MSSAFEVLFSLVQVLEFSVSHLYLSLANFKGYVCLSALSLLPKAVCLGGCPSDEHPFRSLAWDPCFGFPLFSFFCCFIVSDLRWTSSSEGNSDQLRKALLAAPVLFSSLGFLSPAFVCRRALWRGQGRVSATGRAGIAPSPARSVLKALRGVV